MNTRSALARMLAGTCLLTLSGCGAAAQVGSPAAPAAVSPTAPAALRAAPSPRPASSPQLAVSCTPRGISVTGVSVAAGPAGVPLRVSSTAARGTYLNFTWTGEGGGGDAIPRSATTWTLQAPPGQLRLWCSSASRESPKTVVTVVDTGRYWRTTTLADLGCQGATWLDWIAGPGRGATAEAAVHDQVKAMRGPGTGWPKGHLTVRRAEVGYAAAGSATWLVVLAGRPYLTVSVSKDRHGFAASAGALCWLPTDATHSST